MTLADDPSFANPLSGTNISWVTPSSNEKPPHSMVNQLSEESFDFSHANGLVKPWVSLAPFTSFRVGGLAEWYLAPRHLDDLRTGLAWANQEGIPITYLGAGSNLLVSDRGLPGLVICTRYLRYSFFDEAAGQITAATGEPIVRLAWQAADRGWQGLEWAVGIPGTVGGAVVMNAGAHDGCTADILVNAHTISPDGCEEILQPENLGYQYRTSTLQGDRRLVTQATFQLKPGSDPQQVIAITKAHLERRHATQPYHLPNCGSVFRNPHPYKAGWLIEQAGLKGFQIGGAQVSQLHANFIVNCENATANDIFQLIQHIQTVIQERWSIHLEPEVKMLGCFE
jgi:UDP-N-acetylmuramate dehydrogenase